MLLEDAIDLDKYVEIILSEESAVADIATFGAATCAASSSTAGIGAVNAHMQGKGQYSKQSADTGLKQDKGNVTSFLCGKKGRYALTALVTLIPILLLGWSQWKASHFSFFTFLSSGSSRLEREGQSDLKKSRP